MKTTSHFLGIELNNKLFVDLFVELQTFLKEKSIVNTLEFSNPLSAHITLYYFGDKFSSKEYKLIKKEIKLLNKKFADYFVKINNYGIFQRDNIDRLCYLNPTSYFDLNKINEYFRTFFPNSIVDNTQKFFPHVSVFKIIDQQNFNKYKEEIISIIKDYILKIQEENAYLSIGLYCVNSNFRPQIQVKIV